MKNNIIKRIFIGFKKGFEIIEMLQFESKTLVQYKADKNNGNDLCDNDHSMNINVAIASAITSYSRIHMTQFKNNSDYKLFYTDTDSIYINKELPPSFVNSKELGKLKLEIIANKAVFLAPKVYCLSTNDGSHITKVKGLSNEKIIKLRLDDF